MLQALAHLAEDAAARCYRSSAGWHAVVLRLEAVLGSPGVDARLEDVAPRRRIAFVGQAGEAAEGPDDGVWNLAELIALRPGCWSPEDTRPSLGSIRVGGTEFQVFSRLAPRADLLRAGAPVDVGEGPDNLDARERWFRRRNEP